MARPRLYYVLREDDTPEGELSALAAVYRFVLECHEQREKEKEKESRCRPRNGDE